jgi:NTP pyrophosphatase (non-canonical NTP hydrolase)
VDLRRFQDDIARTFGAKDAARGTAGTFMYFMEEVGELAEALREPTKHDLEGEFADCLAWLASLAHLADVDLAAAARKKYGSVCATCGKSPCACESKP